MLEMRPGPKLATAVSLDLLCPYGLCVLLFKESDPTRWLFLEDIVFLGYFVAGLYVTMLFADH